MRVFKSELREALKDPSQLPGDELFESVQYDEGSDEAFLAGSGATSTATRLRKRVDLGDPRTSGNGG